MILTYTAYFTVTYDGNGSDGGTAPTDSSSPYVSGSTVTVLGVGSLTKSGYSFTGWNTAADGSGTAYTYNGSTFSPSSFTISANTTLYAKWTAASATITAPSTFSGAISTTYGTASSPQSVAVSGNNLTANITATVTASGLEISSDNVTYGTTATFTETGGTASGTLYVRLASNAQVSGSYNSQSISLASAGASTVNVATTASGNTVGAKALTVTGAAAQNKLYDGGTAATITGTLNGVVNSDNVTLVGTGTFSSPEVGGPYTVTSTSTLGGTAAGNYTLTQPTALTASIFAGSAAVWNNTAGGLWGAAGNWQNSVIGTGSGQTADFSQVDITADTTVNLDAPYTIGNLVFGNTDTSPAANWTLTNNGTYANTLTLAGTTPTVTVNPLGTGKSATIGAVVAGSSGLTKTGNGTLVLSATNTYTGGTTISNGTVQFSDDNNLGASASGITLQGGTLAMAASGTVVGAHVVTVGTNGGTITCGSQQYQLGTAGLLTGSGALTNSGSGSIWIQQANSGFTGTLYVNGGVTEAGVATALGSSAVTVNSGGELAADNVTLANNLTVDGGTISPNNGGATFSGAISIGAGGMTVANREWWSPSTAQSATISGVISGGALTKTGGGTLTLNNGANSYSGTFVNAGTLTIANSAGAGSGTITLGNGATLGLPSASGVYVGNAVTISGAGATASLTTGNAADQFSGAFSGSSDQTLAIRGTTAVNLGAGSTRQLQNMLGTVSIPSGTYLAFRASTALANGSDNALFDVEGGLSTRNGGNIALGALSGAGSVSMGNSGTSGVGLTYTIGARGTDATFSGVISDGDTANNKRVSVTKTGSGTQTFSGTNTYTGNTTISAGTLALGATGSIDSTPNISLAAGATLDVSAISAYTLSSSTTLKAAGTDSAATIKGNASGTVNLGSQPITLTYDGAHPALTVSQGALQLNGNAFTVNSASPLAVGIYAIVQQTSGSITSAGTYSVNGTAIPGGYVGSISVSSGNVNLIIDTAPVITTPVITLGAQSNVLQTLQIIGGKYAPTDAAGDSLTVSAVTQGTNGGTVAFIGNNVTYISSTVGADSFTYTVSGPGGSSIGQVNVTVTPVVNQQTPQLTFDGSGNRVLTFWGVTGTSYTIQKSSDLTTWTDLTTVTASSTQPYGEISFTDSGAPDGTAGFYRLKP